MTTVTWDHDSRKARDWGGWEVGGWWLCFIVEYPGST